MTRLLERDVPGAPDLRRTSGPKRRRLPLALQLGAMIGLGALLYPSAADWVAALHHDSEVSGYLDAVERLPDAQRETELQAARDYNSRLPQGVLRDPYSAPLGEHEQDAAYRAYEETLSVGGSGVIGRLDYPGLGIALPIYHGTGEQAISQGAGHLYGSSLPIGGPSTHAVLTSHSGLVQASLFTRLPGAGLGDVFELTVLGETHRYRVDRIETVLPEQTEGLGIVEGEDHVTLVTCTPIGVNSHRLLVRGERIEDPAPPGGRQAVAGDGRSAGFPWWAVGFAAGSGAVAYLLFAPPRSRKPDAGSTERTGRTEHETGEERA